MTFETRVKFLRRAKDAIIDCVLRHMEKDSGPLDDEDYVEFKFVKRDDYARKAQDLRGLTLNGHCRIVTGARDGCYKNGKIVFIDHSTNPLSYTVEFPAAEVSKAKWPYINEIRKLKRIEGLLACDLRMENEPER